jgi:hypothetical protein
MSRAGQIHTGHGQLPSVISFHMIIYDKKMEEAVFKRPSPLFWPEQVRKLVTPVLGNRPSAVLEAVSAHRQERPTKRAGSCFPNGQRAVLGPVSGFLFTRSEGHFRIMGQTLSNTGCRPFLGPVLEIGVRQFSRPFFSLARTADKTGWVPFSKRFAASFGTRLGNWGAPGFKAV